MGSVLRDRGIITSAGSVLRDRGIITTVGSVLRDRGIITTVECCCEVDQCTNLDENAQETECPCFMFRSKRSSLVKRLWKCKLDRNEAPCSPESAEELELKSVAQSLLKRLKETQLESLVAAVESNGAETADCVMLTHPVLRLGKRKVAPHVLCCQLWRWPEMDSGDACMRHLPCSQVVGAQEDSSSICCNPYHWSRVLQPGIQNTCTYVNW